MIVNNEEYFQNNLSKNYQNTTTDFDNAVQNANNVINKLMIKNHKLNTVLDLGCGPGAFSKAYFDNGYTVTAIDYCDAFINCAKQNLSKTTVEILKDDIRSLTVVNGKTYSLISCTGDTVLYFETKTEISNLLRKSYELLENYGFILFEFRDLSKKITIEDRIIIKQNERQIKIINLQYEDEYVYTIDCVLKDNETEKSISKKIRITEDEMIELMRDNHFKIINSMNENGKVILFAQKKDF